MIDGKQCTIAWHVDDTKISHIDSKVVSEVIEGIETKFGKMSVTRGEDHVFLGMHIHFRGDGTFSILMKEYLEEAIEEFGEEIIATTTSPATKSLFIVNSNSERLYVDKAKKFHSIVAKLLYVSTRARVDLKLSIAFLCTRVTKSTEHDWRKLKRVLQYIKSTLDMPRILGADSMMHLITWVDASYAVHEDMRGHTGGCMSFGLGVLMPKSSKQKFNTKSSTESEIVGGSDYIPNVIWSGLFLKHQDIILQSSEFNQDNKSTMKLVVNGKRSCGLGSRHIDIRYFFMKNRFDTENINVVYCPTGEMLADFYTKPLQGSLFRKFRDVIMGLQHISTLKAEPILVDQERVGRNVDLKSSESKLVLKDEFTNIPDHSRTLRETGLKINHASTDIGHDVHSVIHGGHVDTPVHRKSYADIVRSAEI